MTGLLAAPKRLCASRRAHMMYREVLAICSLQRNGPEFGVGAVECWNNAELIESASSQIMVNQALSAELARPDLGQHDGRGEFLDGPVWLQGARAYLPRPGRGLLRQKSCAAWSTPT